MEKLELLLDLAAAALIAGDFQALGQLTPQIEAQSLNISHHGNGAAVQAKAKRNARLLDAATRGVKAARLRLTEVARGPTLTTYDARGQKAQISSFAEPRSHRV